MRIPSQFHQDNLYRRENRQNRGDGAARKIIRLAVALALVVVVMRQAGRPEIYKTFFPAPEASAPNAFQAARPSQPPAEDENAAEDEDAGRAEHRPAPTPAMREAAGELAARLSPEARRLATAVLSAPGSSSPPADGEALMAALDGVLDPAFGEDTAGELWLGALRRAGTPDELSRADQQRLAALDSALEKAALARVVDGSTWRSEDTEAFYRYLSRSQQWTSADAPLTGVLPLLQQPDVYRGVRVRVSGRVARAERVDASGNAAAADFGVEEYWQLWLRPDDGSARPVLAVVPNVPEAIAGLDPQATLAQGPPVTVLGKFLKRLAYRSAAGADLAPVVVGRLSQVPVGPGTQAEASRQPVEENDRALLITVFALALLLGGALAAVAMWRTSLAGKRLRRIRAAARPASGEFLQNLASSEATSDSQRNDDWEER